MASETSVTSPNLSSAGTTPEVLTVTRRLEMPYARSSIIRFMASTTLSKFSNGSPIPIITTLVIGRSGPGSNGMNALRATQTCPMISAAVRLRLNPRLPVEQNVQSRLQPICDDTHSVPRSPSGMSTVSTLLPLSMRMTHLRVPSLEDSSYTTSGPRISATAFSFSRSTRLILVI